MSIRAAWRLVICAVIATVGMICLVPAAFAAPNKLTNAQCALRWKPISSTKSETVLRGFLKDCGHSSSAPIARARLPVRDVPPPPPPPPPASRCDKLASLALRTKTLTNLVNYTSSCSQHRDYAEGLRLERLARATQMRQKLDTDMARWGLSFQDLCGLETNDLFNKAMVTSRLPTITEFAGRGDTVAQLLLGYSQIRDFYRLGTMRPQAEENFKTAADAGNPRAMAAYAATLLTRPEPDLQAADRYIDRSAQQSCGYAFHIKAWRSNPVYLKGASGTDAQINAYYQSAIGAGFGMSACVLADRLYPNNYENRFPYYQKALALGSQCGLLYQYEAARVSKGPYATDKAGAIKALNALVESGYDANYHLFYMLTDPAFNGSNSNAAALTYLRRSAELGERYSMVVLGLAYAPFDPQGLGIPAGSQSAQTAVDWCYRAHELGEASGAACVGMFTKEYEQWFKIAENSKKCASYDVATLFFPKHLLGLDGASLTKSIKASSAVERSKWSYYLPKLKYAFSIYEKSNEVCSANAKLFIKGIVETIEPALNAGPVK